GLLGVTDPRRRRTIHPPRRREPPRRFLDRGHARAARELPMKHHSPRFLALTDQARAAVREITPDELLARLGRPDAPVVVDVREDREWAAGRIPGAVHLGRGVIERDVEGVFPDPETEL